MEETVFSNIREMKIEQRRLNVCDIAETVGSSKTLRGSLLHEILGIRKPTARKVPCLVTPKDERSRKTISKQY